MLRARLTPKLPKDRCTLSPIISTRASSRSSESIWLTLGGIPTARLAIELGPGSPDCSIRLILSTLLLKRDTKSEEGQQRPPLDEVTVIRPSEPVNPAVAALSVTTSVQRMSSRKDDWFCLGRLYNNKSQMDK